MATRGQTLQKTSGYKGLKNLRDEATEHLKNLEDFEDFLASTNKYINTARKQIIVDPFFEYEKEIRKAIETVYYDSTGLRTTTKSLADDLAEWRSMLSYILLDMDDSHYTPDYNEF